MCNVIANSRITDHESVTGAEGAPDRYVYLHSINNNFHTMQTVVAEAGAEAGAEDNELLKPIKTFLFLGSENLFIFKR